MRPLNKLEIRDLNLELQERLCALQPMKSLVVVQAFRGRKCYGIGLNDPKKDLILRNLVRLMGGIYRPKPPSETTTTVSLTDIGNVARTVYIALAGGCPTFLSGSVTYALSGALLGFGNPATAPTPTRTDYELSSKVAEITPSSTTTDETNWRVIVTGSYVWVSGGTVRETGQYGYYCDTGGTWRTFLNYYDAVSDVVVPPSGTVSVTYTTQF